jgi:hypothetical protein
LAGSTCKPDALPSPATLNVNLSHTSRSSGFFRDCLINNTEHLAIIWINYQDGILQKGLWLWRKKSPPKQDFGGNDYLASLFGNSFSTEILEGTKLRPALVSI